MFDYEIFKKEINGGDIWGLEYLEKTIIADYKKKIKEKNDVLNYTKEEYIVNLFYAVKDLNLCNEIYETSDVKNNFDYDLYFGTRDLLLKEMEFNLEDLFD